MKDIIVLENIRSAYNVGNVLRTADGLGFDVVLSGYTAHPQDEARILKTSLWSEHQVNLQQFWNPQHALDRLQSAWYIIIAAETGPEALDLPDWEIPLDRSVAIVFGNERTGVLSQTLRSVDAIVQIPMVGIKESFNVSQSSAIFMWEVVRKKAYKKK